MPFFAMPFDIVKTDTTKQLVYGWGNISVDAEGETITDQQDDQIDPSDLEDAVVQFMLDVRDSGVMHEGSSVGQVVASFVTTPDLMKAFFGAVLPEVPVGWMVGVKVADATIFQRVVNGELRAFSIQGQADRVPA